MIYYETVLPLLFIVPAFVIVSTWMFMRKNQRLQGLIDPALFRGVIPGLSYTRKFWRNAFFMIGVTLLIIALLRPRWGMEYKNIERTGQDILIAIDVSKSMLAEDIKPSRLKRASLEIQRMITLLKGDRMGLILFSGTSVIQCPLTHDYAALSLFLNDISVNTISKPGTDISGAIQLALTGFESTKRRFQSLIILTDGEYFEGDPEAWAQKAMKSGLNIYSVGLGSTTGEPIPIKNKEGRVTHYAKDKQGRLILSRLNSDVLKRVSEKTGGRYFQADQQGLIAEKVYELINEKEKKRFESASFEGYHDRYQIFLFLGFISFCLFILIIEKKPHKDDDGWQGRI